MASTRIGWLLAFGVVAGCVRASVLLVLMGAAACDAGKVVRSTPGYRVNPSELAFGRAPVGKEVRLPVAVTSASRARQQLTLRTVGPFQAVGDLLLEGGARVELEVAFVPTGAGAVVGELIVEGEEQTVHLALSAEGVVVTDCPEPTGCGRFTFDVDSGTCVAFVAADGAACSTACVTHGSCLAGGCLGDAKSCDDHDACTTDSCDATSGCVHLDAAERCPLASNPCFGAFCDPATGCGQAQVADGTACGASDCTTSRVCIGGQCWMTREGRPR